MRRSGMYLSGGLYLECAGKYYERKEWKRKWKKRAGRSCILFLLALTTVWGSITAVRAGKDLAGTLTKAEQTESRMAWSVPARTSEVQVLAGDLVMEQTLQKLEEIKSETTAVCLPNVPGSTAKAPEDLLIVLDPGHGGEDEGCSESGIQEKDVNLTIALLVQTKLQEKGYQVRLTRDSDVGLALPDRVKTAEEAGADIFVSIHQNFSDAPEAQGMEVLYSAQNQGEESERLAKLIQKYVLQSTKAEERTILEEESLHVIRECTMASCLVETGFLSSPSERAKLLSPEYQEQIAEGIVSGIELYFYPKTMYLTFDDGPSRENTGAILDILKARDIKATFFVVGENVRKYPEVARRIVEEGHTIGIHCNQHDYDRLYASVDSYLEDFQEAYDAVKEVTGVEAKLFRFPGGSINSHNKGVYQDIIEAMTEKGFIYYD